MKQLKLLYFVIVSLFLVNAHADGHFGVVMISKGTVKLTTTSGDEQSVTVGLEVSEGDKLVTGLESTAKIVTMDRNVLVIGEKSEITFEKYQSKNENQKTVLIDVKEGSVRSSLKQKYQQKEEFYQIKTPTSVTGVRGTDFYVEHNKAADENVICTFEGKVSYKPNESTSGFLVEAGKFVRHKKGQGVKIVAAKPEWVEKTLKTLEVTGKEEPPVEQKSKSVK